MGVGTYNAGGEDRKRALILVEPGSPYRTNQLQQPGIAYRTGLARQMLLNSTLFSLRDHHLRSPGWWSHFLYLSAPVLECRLHFAELDAIAILQRAPRDRHRKPVDARTVGAPQIVQHPRLICPFEARMTA